MGILDSIMTPVSQADDPLAEREKWLQMSQLFNSFTMNPNASQGYYDSQQKGIDRKRESIALRSGNKLEAETLTRQSGMALQILGDKFPMLSQALQAGIVSPNDAITAARKGSDVKVVGKSLVDSTGKVLFTSPDASGGDTAALQTLKGRAVEAGLKEGTPAYQQFMLNAGKANGMSLTIGPDGSIQMTQGGAAPIKLTETQGKATGFYERANNSNKIITDLENTGTDLGQFILGQIPMTNFARSPEYQMLDSAKRDWISAVLRLESGAAIGKDEFTNYDLAYFPQVGDSPEVLKQKRRSRLIHENSLKTQAGTGVASSTAAGGSTVLTYNPVTGELE